MAQVPRPPAPGAVQAAIQQLAPPPAAAQGQPPAAQQQQVAPAAQQGQGVQQQPRAPPAPQVPQQQGGGQQPLPAAQPAQGQAQPNPVGPAGAAQPDAPPQPPQEDLLQIVRTLQATVDGLQRGNAGVRAILRDIPFSTRRQPCNFVEDLATAAKRENHRKAEDYQSAAELLRLHRHDPKLKQAIREIYATESERKVSRRVSGILGSGGSQSKQSTPTRPGRREGYQSSGHWSYAPQPWRPYHQPQYGGRRCYGCGSPEHLVAKCPARRASRERSSGRDRDRDEKKKD
ncbi:hypothetical protein Bbelb_444190 [Branchiostoma belcheri]|nr:hypothetical protein Bbelb_444190 [Branchiostoma belcheri]